MLMWTVDLILKEVLFSTTLIRFKLVRLSCCSRTLGVSIYPSLLNLQQVYLWHDGTWAQTHHCVFMPIWNCLTVMACLFFFFNLTDMPQPELSASWDLRAYFCTVIRRGTWGNVRSDWLVEGAQWFEGGHFHSDHKGKVRNTSKWRGSNLKWGQL